MFTLYRIVLAPERKPYWICLVPRRLSLSLDENVRAKEGGKETKGETSLRLPSVPFPWSLAVHHQSLLYLAKNEAPEEEADTG